MEGNGPCLDTVRALHQTVVSLRAALEQSRSEILELRDKAWPLESVESALRALSIENHVLRRKILENGVQNENENKNKRHVTIASPPVVETPKKYRNDGGGCGYLIKNKSRSLENLGGKNTTIIKHLSISKTVSYSNINESATMMDNSKTANSEIKENNENNPTVTITQPRNSSVDNSQTDLDQDQEVDDIELIFTTDDTKDSDFKEQLVSIEVEAEENSNKHLQCPTSDPDQTLDNSDRELEDDVFKENDVAASRNLSFELKRDASQLCASRSDNSINHEEKSLKSCYSYQDSSFENKSLEKDESFDRFEERIRIIETDISKIGIQDVEYAVARRNTCPNPLQYRPFSHRYVF